MVSKNEKNRIAVLLQPTSVLNRISELRRGRAVTLICGTLT